MEPVNPSTADQSAQAPAAALDGAPGLSTPEQIAQLAEQLIACAEVLHARVMHAIRAYGGGPVPLKAQETARELLDDEQVLRQRADGMIADAATLVVHSLAKSQRHILKLTADASEKLKNLTELYDAIGIVGRLLEIGGAVATGNPAIIMRSLEDMQHMLEGIDRPYRTERVLKRAVSVLQDADAAREWLSRANRSLGGEVPLAMLDTEDGYQLVLDTLARIEYGVIS
jgi:putative toxin-antitoxin system antitoxin component (TIGR02293 family)